MKFKTAIAAAFAVVLSCASAFGQATILPPGETCFQATTGVTGMVGALGTITGGILYTTGTYGGVSLTGGTGSGATANITVSGGAVTAVVVLNPGVGYVVGDVLSASSASIGGTGTGFSIPVNSVSINSSLAGGSVGFYIPNTNTVKQTWQDAGETILNQNPVPLDQNGCAVIYGAGIYRMIVQDSLGNTVYDKLTASTGTNGPFWAAQAGGTGNAITITDTAFSLQDGATIQFLALATNTGPATISISGGSPISIVRDTSSGPAALTGGEIAVNNTPMMTYDATYAEFHLVNPATTNSSGGGSSSLTPPQGYLNLVGAASGSVVQSGDVVGATTVYYSPYVGNTIPVWTGSTFKTLVFSELTATLTGAGSTGSSIQDACVFSNNGIPTLAIGPAWTTATAGAGNRGTGAGTAQITRQQGIWVNANTITGYNGLSSFSIPANQCTIVGSLSIDATAGQVSAYRTYGQSRKWGVWNFYNRQLITLKAGDSTANWTPISTVLHPSNSNTANSLTVFSGLPEEPYMTAFNQRQTAANATSAALNGGNIIGLGWNSTSAASGQEGQLQFVYGGGSLVFELFGTTSANYIAPPSLGINVVTSLEAVLGNVGSGQTQYGTESQMLLSASWRG